MTPIPRFIVCRGDAELVVEAIVDFIAIDIPCNDRDRRAMLMFSTSAKAREFISNESNPSDWHVRCFDRCTLCQFFVDPRNRVNFDSVVVDWPGDGHPRVTAGFDADPAAEALAAAGFDDESPVEVESWQVFI